VVTRRFCQPLPGLVTGGNLCWKRTVLAGQWRACSLIISTLVDISPRRDNIAAMSIPRKRHWFKRLWGDPLLCEAIIALAALLLAIWEALYSSNKDVKERRVICVCASVIFIFTILKSVIAWCKSLRKESPHELFGCLQTLHAILLAEGKAVLRITIHVPAMEGQEVEQVMDYVGEPHGKKTAGRRFPSQSGIVGEAFRRKLAVSIGERINEDYEAFIQELVKDWHYTEADARKCNPSARSWMAVPLSNDEQEVEGIIFFDCNERHFFTTDRAQIAICAAAGIAKFIKKRY